MSTPRIDVTRKTFKPGDRLSKLSKFSVLVGIPQKNNARAGESIGNAALMYVFSNGSPKRRQPARPVIQPAIEAPDNKKVISADLKDAAVAQLQGAGPTKVLDLFRNAGQEAANLVKGWFTDPRNGWAPNAPSTIARKGSDRPGIDTGDMRKKVSYVVEQQS